MNPIFNYDNGDYIWPTSDNMGIDSNGDLHMRMGDNMSLDMNTGEMHFTSGWLDDDDDDFQRKAHGRFKLCVNVKN